METRFAVVSDPVRKAMGGIENHARILCNLLSNHGYNVTIIEYDKLRIGDIKDYDVVVIEGIHRKTLLKTILMRKRSRMLLFTHGSFYLTSEERKDLRKFDSSKEFFFKIIFDKIFIKTIFKRFDKIITLSDSESRDLLKQFAISPEKLSSLEVFSDETDKEAKTQEDMRYGRKEYVCYVGRLDYRKNLISLLMACHKLDLPLLVAGQDQGVLAELESYCRENAYNKFHYLGIISKNDKITLIKNSLIVAIPSFFEGTPLVAIEALKLGKNVIMTCNSYMIEHPCITFSKTDSDSLAHCIRGAMKSKGCDTGFISNGEILKKFIEIVNTVSSKKKNL